MGAKKKKAHPRQLTANDYVRIARADYVRGGFTAAELQHKIMRLLARVLAAQDLLREDGAVMVLDTEQEDMIIGVLLRTIQARKVQGRISPSD